MAQLLLLLPAPHVQPLHQPGLHDGLPDGRAPKRDDGLVLRDEEVCMGDRFCMEACPYKKVYFNYDRHVAQQCIGCFPRVEAGVAPGLRPPVPGPGRVHRLPR